MRRVEISRQELEELSAKLADFGSNLNEKETVLISGLFGLASNALAQYFNLFVNKHAIPNEDQKINSLLESLPELVSIDLPDVGEVVSVEEGFRSTFYQGGIGELKLPNGLRYDPYSLGAHVPIQCIESARKT